jgi:1,4-dihydroxy-6-naphthoate synthase
MTQKLSLGFSPCPNDTFMFDALVHEKTDTEGLRFDVQMDDVEALNQRALRGEIDVTKISFAAYTRVTDTYQLLDAGSALGNGVGPLLISKISYPESKVPEFEKLPFRETILLPIFFFHFSFPGNE